MTYKEYILRHAQVRNTPVGDFIADARTDANLPDTQREICAYVLRVGCYEAHLAERRCYSNYIKCTKRKNRHFKH